MEIRSSDPNSPWRARNTTQVSSCYSPELPVPAHSHHHQKVAQDGHQDHRWEKREQHDLLHWPETLLGTGRHTDRQTDTQRTEGNPETQARNFIFPSFIFRKVTSSFAAATHIYCAPNICHCVHLSLYMITLVESCITGRRRLRDINELPEIAPLFSTRALVASLQSASSACASSVCAHKCIWLIPVLCTYLPSELRDAGTSCFICW